MLITSVEAIPVSYPEPNDFDALRHLCLVKLTTDDGAVGWGEAVTMWPESSFATAAIIDGMADLVIEPGPPAQRPTSSGDLKQHAWWYGHNGGIASFRDRGASDIALWDLKG